MTARGKKIVLNSNGVSMPLEAYIKSGVTENHRGKSKKKKMKIRHMQDRIISHTSLIYKLYKRAN